MGRVVLNKNAQFFAMEKVSPLVTKCARAITAQARKTAPGGPYSRGNLKRSIFREVGEISRTRVTQSVGSRLIYAYSVHEGQPARTITPSRATALRFFWRKVGRNVVLPYVKHPGTQGQPYLTDAMRKVAPRFGFKTIRYYS